MMLTDFPLSQYLARIGLNAAPAPTESGLRQIHLAQALSIPFEDLDIHLGRPISLKPADLVSKLIFHRRGGYCFELNGLLHLALTSMGFDVRPILARVLYGLQDPSPRTHEVLIVTISGSKWLADVGFGGPGLREPLLLLPNQIAEQCGDIYRLQADARYGMILQKRAGEGFIDIYAFDEDEVTLDGDIEMANHYTATWPESLFRLLRMCALPTPDGRVTLAGMELTLYRNGESTSRVLQPGSPFMAAMSEYFGIELDARYEDLSPLRATPSPGK